MLSSAGEANNSSLETPERPQTSDRSSEFDNSATNSMPTSRKPLSRTNSLQYLSALSSQAKTERKKLTPFKSSQSLQNSTNDTRKLGIIFKIPHAEPSEVISTLNRDLHLINQTLNVEHNFGEKIDGYNQIPQSKNLEDNYLKVFISTNNATHYSAIIYAGGSRDPIIPGPKLSIDFSHAKNALKDLRDNAETLANKKGSQLDKVDSTADEILSTIQNNEFSAGKPVLVFGHSKGGQSGKYLGNKMPCDYLYGLDPLPLTQTRRDSIGQSFKPMINIVALKEDASAYDTIAGHALDNPGLVKPLGIEAKNTYDANDLLLPLPIPKDAGLGNSRDLKIPFYGDCGQHGVTQHQDGHGMDGYTAAIKNFIGT